MRELFIFPVLFYKIELNSIKSLYDPSILKGPQKTMLIKAKILVIILTKYLFLITYYNADTHNTYILTPINIRTQILPV